MQTTGQRKYVTKLAALRSKMASGQKQTHCAQRTLQTIQKTCKQYSAQFQERKQKTVTRETRFHRKR